MAIISLYEDKRLLIIDDLPEMRSSLRAQAASLGFEKVSLAGSVRDALDLLRTTRFDIILCDYYLGGATDGQQFLEFLRTRNLISRATLFIMITAEKGYEKVVTAAECMPDDDLLKPFTAESVKARVDRLLEKKTRLAKIDRLQDQGRWQDIVAACDEIIADRDKYLLDAMRVKGNALIMASRFDEAVGFYRDALKMRPMPWAKLGLARALRGRGDREEARQVLDQAIAETPTFLAAYDLLGRLHQEDGKPGEALKVLDRACGISPNALARHRAIAGVAEDLGDHGRVEQAMTTVVEKTRNSPLRDAADYARLGSALAEMGDPARAIAVIEEAKGTFKGDAEAPLLAAAEAVAQQKAGNAAAARQALERALQADSRQLSEATTMAIAKACLANGRADEAEARLKYVLQNNPEQSALQASVSRIMEAHGDPARARNLIQSSVAEIIQLNNDAVKKGQAGELAAAAAMLSEAADRLPGNLQIVANAAYALLVDVFTNGMDAAKLRDAQRFRQSVQERDPEYPKLNDIAEIGAQVQRKYGSAP